MNEEVIEVIRKNIIEYTRRINSKNSSGEWSYCSFSRLEYEKKINSYEYLLEILEERPPLKSDKLLTKFDIMDL